MTNDETLIKFPCEFLIKIIGKNSELFVEEIIAIAKKYYPDLQDTAIRRKPSQQGTYLAISITVYAQDQATLDALYIKLTQHPDIKMVL